MHIILDIDGVLATDSTYKVWRKAGESNDFDALVGLLDPGLVAMVDGLAREAGAAIVVSSNWRFHDVCPHPVDDVLRAAGITVPIVGHTPVLGPPEWRERPNQRGYEINAYIVAHGLALDQLVIFDDDVWATRTPIGSPVRHGGRVVLTAANVGILPRNIARARKMLGLVQVPAAGA
jgi:hypothetical protein